MKAARAAAAGYKWHRGRRQAARHQPGVEIYCVCCCDGINIHTLAHSSQPINKKDDAHWICRFIFLYIKPKRLFVYMQAQKKCRTKLCVPERKMLKHVTEKCQTSIQGITTTMRRHLIIYFCIKNMGCNPFICSAVERDCRIGPYTVPCV